MAPLLDRIGYLLGFGVMHPEVRATLGIPWSPRDQAEFKILWAALRTAYRALPTDLALTALGRNRRRFDRLTAKYGRIGLDTFAPPTCPARSHQPAGTDRPGPDPRIPVTSTG